MRRHIYCLGLAAAVGAMVLLAGCGGNRGLFGNGASSSPSGQGGTVTLTVSDPATCGGGAPYSGIWLSIADVQASPNASAAAGDSSFVDLTPKLKSAPMQINLASPTAQCTLASLVNAAPATAQNYQQVRVFLAPDAQAASIPNNACGAYANCAKTASGIEPIAVGTAATEGIPIAGPALAGGFTVASGAAVTVNINFDACAALAVSPGGALSLAPQVSGGAISASADTIAGTFQDAATHAPVTGPVLVALEQNQGGTDRVLMQTFANASGGFQFCPVPAGKYEIVAGAVSSSGGQYSPAAVLQVPNGASLNTPPLPLYAGNGTNAEPAAISATLTSTGAGGAATPVNAVLAVQAKVTPVAGAAYSLAIPLPGETSAVLPLNTALGPACPGGTACAGPVTLETPAMFVSFASFQTGQLIFQDNAGVSAAYLLDARAFAAGGGAAPACSPSEVTVNPGQISPNAHLTAPPLAFTGC